MGRPADQLNRLLTLIPYFLANDGIELDVAVRELGVGASELVADLQQLSLSGLPGKLQLPGDMIDVYEEDGRVHLSFLCGDLKRPLRLTSSEATVLLMALRTVIETHATDPAPAERAIAKIEVAASGQPALPDAVTSVNDGKSAVLDTVRRAVRDKVALRIRYYTPSRDSAGDRTVDPVGTQVVDRFTYLSAWCRQSEGMRLFRFDRIDDATLLDETSAPPAGAQSVKQSPVLSDNPDLPTVELVVDEPARWAFEYFLLEPHGQPDADGAQGATLRYGSDEWLARFILGFGGQIRIVGSDDAAAQVARRVADAATAARVRYS
ncbi:WYL domain-containing protein [Gordonia sp. TBRC 11910]|uniref:WYL domain-containing protein n=1 Tax=Gordonia asplenii TaxID=2725283 RepID=A0A848L2U1_9ACTN|nr:WYL domain-containing protein [Gordonia asplenii]NMO05154.1 WYL domain-containing protein [Gordonia asplenii]